MDINSPASKPLILIADKVLGSQALLGDLLAPDAQIATLLRESQFDIWLDEPSERPALLILDYAFFGDQTADFCRRWAAHPEMRNVAIVMTGPDNETAELQAFSAGAQEYLAKPLKPVLALARIRTLLAREAELRRLASLSATDGLTGLANRRSFAEFYDAEWRRACREKGSLGLIMIDIDYFKPYNDQYGHQGGDQCLRHVSSRLKTVLQRPRDFIARYGGEEFVVVLPSVKTHGVTVVAERLQQAIAELAIPHEASPAGSAVTLSMGLAWCEPDSDISPEQLITAADEALYTAKDEGRNRFSEVVVLQEPVFQAN